MEIVRRSDDQKSFQVQTRRWMVERTFSCLGRNRRLAKDTRTSPARSRHSSLASIRLAPQTPGAPLMTF
jgi:transposase